MPEVYRAAVAPSKALHRRTAAYPIVKGAANPQVNRGARAHRTLPGPAFRGGGGG
ncbi:hypothetical protein GCM10009530_08310 [Microbispora corallina]|uniref:Uncharacterized protein n=1 Tax=Microbispora corallina TaxID=83302 RepID=A0ABQ4FVF4_9ACTN|nr:hypothetical protein Mco01_17940 [Microbispora corallina]